MEGTLQGASLGPDQLPLQQGRGVGEVVQPHPGLAALSGAGGMKT